MKRLVLAAIVILTGCTPVQQTSAAVGLEEAYIAADGADLAYVQSGKSTAPIRIKIDGDRAVARAAMAPILAAATCVPAATAPCTTVIDASEQEAAAAAIAALEADVPTVATTH